MHGTITREELKNKLDAGENIKLINVLDRSSFDAVHIPGSINIPLEELSERAEHELGKDEEIIVYCSSSTCQASPAAAEKLDKMGYTMVYHFKGGIAGWKEAGYPLEGEAV
ncbi:MAG: rhodanese-like domain-containing protein [Candidatus Methanoperedens sp.]|nr:rhodanese-like domain-containing protein [Candidatus Methanoperedens sp.]